MRDRAFGRQIANATDAREIYDLVAVRRGGITELAPVILLETDKIGRTLVTDDHVIFGGEAKPCS